MADIDFTSEPPQKTCNDCQQAKPLSEYNKDKSVKNGLCRVCRDCQRIRRKAYYEATKEESKRKAREDYWANRDVNVARAKARYHSDPEYYRECSKQWKLAHPEQVKEQKKRSLAKPEIKKAAVARAKRWAERNTERYKTSKKNWRINNPEKVRVNHVTQKARRKNAPGTHTAEDIKILFKQQKGKCYYCGCKLSGEYHIDHFIPLSKGGTNDPGNLRIACPTCNLKKNDKMPWEFGRLI